MENEEIIEETVEHVTDESVEQTESVNEPTESLEA